PVFPPEIFPMSLFDRRNFLASSAGALAAASFGFPAAAQEKAAKVAKKEKATPVPVAVNKDPLASLFLTWQRDPTTTMTIQWVGAPSAQDIRVSPLTADQWQTAKPTTKPFPDTELNVHRCELTGLAPGTEYKFQIGVAATDFR